MTNTPYPQELARKFLTSFDDVKLKLVQVASTDGQDKNLYALRIEDGETLYSDTKLWDFLIKEETLKDAVMNFIVYDSLSGSEFQYPITNDLLNAVFEIVKVKLHDDIVIGHIELLFNPYAYNRLVEDREIGQLHGFAATVDREAKAE